MSETYQTETQTILEHGNSVWTKTQDLILGNFDNFRLPEWFISNHHFLVNNLHDWKIIKDYTIMHDCGKVYCITFDEFGKRHFPNHAEISAKVYSEYFPEQTEVIELIANDMLLHTSKYDEVMSKGLSAKTLITLLLVSFAEIHANAELFGGIESTSFKIKYKHLDKLGKKLIAKITKFNDKYAYVFVRTDLEIPAHIVVQSAHAIFERAKQKNVKHPSIICLSAESERDIKDKMKYLLDNNIQFSIFRESMSPYNGQITAIATESLDLERKQLLRKFDLLKI